MQITVNLTGLDAIKSQFAKLGKAPQQALAVTAEKVEDYIQSQIGKHAKTGAMERSLTKKRVTDGWVIGHDPRVAPYAQFVHDGTRPHLIKPKPGNGKKSLRWAIGGRFIFARSVKHPGTKPDLWMNRAAALAPQIFAAQLNAMINAQG